MKIAVFLKSMLIFLILFSSRCGDSMNILFEDPSEEAVRVKALVSIEVTPSSGSVAKGLTLQYTAIGEYTDTSTSDITSTVTWTSSDTLVATINASGLATAVAVGTSTIKATQGAINDSKTFTVTAAGTYTADGVTFKMVLVPGGMTFPTDTNDSTTATVANSYWIGETEVTYELWKKVYTWATSGSGGTGAGLYTFSNQGREGHDGTIGAGATNQEPVTTINWRDSMVWCNALTEWYNAQKSTSYSCVYYKADHTTPIRTSTNDTTDTTPADGKLDNYLIDGSEDCPFVKTNATGFRLPTSNEWELAARYRGTDTTNVVIGTVLGVDFSAMVDKWTKGNSASGATDYAYTTVVNPLDTAGETGPSRTVAWYFINSGLVTNPVMGKTANSLGLYDMSGNVWEWCFDWYPGESGFRRVGRGGGWWANPALFLQVGYVDGYGPYVEGDNGGLRFVRTQ